MLDYLGPDLDELLTQRPQRPLLHRLGQCQTPQEIAEVVGQGEQLKADLIINEIMTRKPRPVQGVLTFLNPLLRCASLVIELDHIAGFPTEIRDYEVDSWKKLSRMPFDLGDYSASDIPTGCLIPKAMI